MSSDSKEDVALSPPPPKTSNVCLLGLSADPPTRAHGAMVCELLELKADDGRLLDQVWWLPVYQHMYENKRSRMTPWEHRWNLCQLAARDYGEGVSPDNHQNHQRVLVSDAERQCWEQAQPAQEGGDGEPSCSMGTVDVLEYLQAQYPQYNFWFCVGADAFCDLVEKKSWKQSDRILELLQGRLIVVHRTERETTEESNRQKHLAELLSSCPGARLLSLNNDNHISTGVSSTAARGCDTAKQLQEFVIPTVAAYIQQHGLYGMADVSKSEHDDNTDKKKETASNND